jgi:hypothetical protein
MQTIDLGNNEQASRGVFPAGDGTFTAVSFSRSKGGFKTQRGAQGWLDRAAAPKPSAFCQWLDTFLSEKGIDLEAQFEVEGASGVNLMPYSVVVDGIKATTAAEQAQIKTVLVRIDFQNGDVCHFLRHIAKALAI